MDGLFITFDGPDGSGKSTQVKRLGEYIKDTYGKNVIFTREPGGVAISEAIRSILMQGGMCPKAELLLFIAARAEFMNKLVRPNLDLGDVVLCDRFWDSTIAYQGYGRGLCIDQIHEFNEFATDDMSPQITFILDVDPEVGASRMDSRGGEVTTFDTEEIAFKERVRDGYLEIAESGGRYRLIDANKSEDEVFETICDELDKFMEQCVRNR